MMRLGIFRQWARRSRNPFRKKELATVWSSVQLNYNTLISDKIVSCDVTYWVIGLVFAFGDSKRTTVLVAPLWQETCWLLFLLSSSWIWLQTCDQAFLFFPGARKSMYRQRGETRKLFPIASQTKIREEGPPHSRLRPLQNYLKPHYRCKPWPPFSYESKFPVTCNS